MGCLQLDRRLLGGSCLSEGCWLLQIAFDYQIRDGQRSALFTGLHVFKLHPLIFSLNSINNKKNKHFLTLSLLLYRQSVSRSVSHSPLFLWLRDLFQSTAGFLQLCQGIGRRQGWHGWVLDERVAWVVASKVRSAADATSTPGRMRPTRQRLWVERDGFL